MESSKSKRKAPGKVELEIVDSPADRHFHLGVDDRALNHRLLLADT